jgi:recombination protein RecR
MARKYPETVEELIGLLKSLPGVGRRSAERMALSIIKWDTEKLEYLASAVSEAAKRISFCPKCGNLSEDDALCVICQNVTRDESTICVVEDFSQIISIEESAFYKGLYHVLGGKLSPLSGIGPDKLNIASLIKRLEDSEVSEIILALSPDVEGQATAIYLSGQLSGKKIKMTRLAQGLPAGSDISYADAATIGVALSGRTLLND